MDTITCERKILIGHFRQRIIDQYITLVIICGRLKARPSRIGYCHRAIHEFKRDVGTRAIDRDDRGVLVGVGIGAIPGGVGGDGGGGEG